MSRPERPDVTGCMQVTDTKPKRPSWGLMSSSSEGVATAIAAWGHFVIMGDTEGSLNRWDTQSGRISTVQTTQVPSCQVSGFAYIASMPMHSPLAHASDYLSMAGRSSLDAPLFHMLYTSGSHFMGSPFSCLQGPVRRIHFAPPAAEELVRGSGNPSARGRARVSVLFANGTFGIWELNSRNELQQVGVLLPFAERLS